MPMDANGQSGAKTRWLTLIFDRSPTTQTCVELRFLGIGTESNARISQDTKHPKDVEIRNS